MSALAADLLRFIRQPSFSEWLEERFPSWRWDWPHLRLIQQQLERVRRGEVRRLMIFLPPRHGKSETATIRFPVYCLLQNPAFRVCVGAYNASFAERFGRNARKIARECLPLSDERTAAREWETLQGGVFRSCGVGNPPTGEGFDLLIVDDPIKSRDEAESPAFRQRVQDWFTTDLYTRLEPGAAVVLIMTRWRSDDLAGFLLQQAADGNGDQWEVLNLPALAEGEDPLGRPEGAALCPDRYPVEELERIKSVLGSYSFNALYQGRPAPREGGMFRREWFEIIPAVPAECRFVRWWDKAASAGKGDHTAGVLLGSKAGLYYVADVVRGQWSANQRNDIMRQTAELDRQRYGAVQVWTEQEPGSGGKESAEATVRLLAGFPVRYEPSTGSKEARADPFAAQCEAGNVKVVRGPWNADFLDELCTFPFGSDDCVDAVAGAFNKLAARQVTLPVAMAGRGRPAF